MNESGNLVAEAAVRIFQNFKGQSGKGERTSAHSYPLWAALEEAGLAHRDDVIEVFSRRLRTAYPIYDRGYAAFLAVAVAWLSGIENLWLLGRQALFLHNNTHHSLRMGYLAADAIGDGDRVAWNSSVAELSMRMVED